MKKLTKLLLTGSVKERRKSSRKMQQLVELKCRNWQGRNESNWLTNAANLGLHSPVMMSRHQEKFKEILCKSRQGSQVRQLRINQRPKE